MSPAFSRRGDQVICLLGFIALILCLWVFTLRLFAVYETAGIGPGTAQTTGCEEESMFAVWNAAHGMPVFADPTLPPFAASYFNWLFYTIYGAVGRLAGESALIFAGRSLTAGIALLTVVFLGLCFARNGKTFPLRIAGLIVAFFLFLGPLSGWWSVTLRPDIPALALETIGLVVFLALHHRRPLSATFAAIGLFYCAWSFKPICLAAPLAVGLFLLWHRCWRDALLLAIGSAALWSLTFAIGGPVYRLVILQTATDNIFAWHQGMGIMRHAAICLAPLLLFAPSLLLAWRRHRAWQTRSPAHDSLHLFCVAILPVTLLFSIAAAKIGAGPNYFFSPAMLLTIAVGFGLFRLESARTPTVLALLVIIIFQAGLIGGRWGVLDLRPNATQLAARWDVFRQQPEPRFSHDLRLNLPWLNPNSPPLVLSYNYRLNRDSGKPYGGEGMGGMINRGEFASLLLPTSTDTHYDGGSLDRYKRHTSVDNFTIFLRRDTARPLP